MSVLAITMLILVGACWLAGVTHLIAGLRRSLSPMHLSFALFALVAGAHSLAYISLHLATDATQYVEAARWGVTGAALSAAALIWFVRFYTGASSLALPLILSILYAGYGIANLYLPYGMFFMRNRCTKQGHNPVAHDVVDRSFVAVHGRHHELQHRVEELSRLFGVALSHKQFQGTF